MKAFFHKSIFMTASNSTKPLDLAYEAGSILLENGAEISRVEETMQRIASHYGVEDKSFFVLISGIFPLVPGAGIFWTSYNIVSNQLSEALQTGFGALKATVAIAFGILVIMELNGKGMARKWLKKKK